MNRRTVLLMLAAAGVGAGTVAAVGLRPYQGRDPQIPAPPREGAIAWRNWSGNQFCYPETRAAPTTEDELAAIIGASDAPVRVAGAGHSFSALVPTDETLLSLDLMGDVLAVDLEAGEARLQAGGRIGQLAPALARQGAAFRNLPDINKQTMGGAVATATHGTGKDYPSMSGEMTGLRMVLADGSRLDASLEQDADVFRAAQVALGSLGVISEMRYRIEPRHRLHRVTWFERYDDLVGRARTLFAKHSQFEFFYIPWTNHCLAISHDRTDRAPTGPRAPEDNSGLFALKDMRDWLWWAPAIRRRLGEAAVADSPVEDVVGENYELLTSERSVRFNEIEYHLPMDQGLEALDEVRAVIETKYPGVFFPVEVRMIKGDEAWLSPFGGADRISVAVHAFYRDSFDFFFSSIEPIFRRRGGRPHWGKMNTLGPEDFAALYPCWNDFARIRRDLDPQGKFLNRYLRSLFEA